jgi:hypothetical protein
MMPFDNNRLITFVVGRKLVEWSNHKWSRLTQGFLD